MAVTIIIPAALKQYADNQDSIELSGSNLNDLLNSLIETYPKLKKHLLDDSGKLRNFVNVYLNDENIRYLDQQNTVVKDGDTIMLVPAVAGGKDSLKEPASTGDEGSTTLSNEEIERYSRHLIMPEVGLEGQLKLKKSSVLLIGMGGLGSPLALYLAAAGVGRIGLVDFDVVEATNLQRQVIYTTNDVGRHKLQSAKEAINAINPQVKVDTYETMLTSENALEILEPFDIIIDGTDNFPTRYLVNDACVLLGKPNVYGSIFRFEGQASVFYAREGPCYRCLYPEPPPPGLVPSCAEGGVLGILPGTIGLIQATEAVKLILHTGEPLIGRMLLYNALTMKFRELKVRKEPDCPICGEDPTITELINYEQFCGIGTEQDRITLEPEEQISATGLKSELDEGRDLFILDVRQPQEYDICRLPNSKLIPLNELDTRVVELERKWEIVVHCRLGERSAQATKFLREAGFRKVRNLVGGILAWSDEVDPSVPKY